jgi:hypothetical protein
MSLPMSAPVHPASPRADLTSALAWVALGTLIVVISWRMDRLVEQGATIHTAPGLWPGIIGTLLALLGGALVLRSLRRAKAAGWDAAEADETDYVPLPRFLLAAGLFFVYALLLVGKGVPFWLGTALFVTVFVWLFQLAQRKAAGQQARGAVVALACGVLTALVVTLVFEKIFYVRLP